MKYLKDLKIECNNLQSIYTPINTSLLKPTPPKNIKNWCSPIRYSSKITDESKIIDEYKITDSSKIIDEYKICGLLIKTKYKEGEWSNIKDSKLVKIKNKTINLKNELTNIARHVIKKQLNTSDFIINSDILKNWIVTIVKDTYYDIYIVANMWYLLYFDKFYSFEDPELDFIDSQLNRISYNLKPPDKKSWIYNYLFNLFLILRKKSVRYVYDHKINIDCNENISHIFIIWDEIWLPLLVTYEKLLLSGKLPKPEIL